MQPEHKSQYITNKHTVENRQWNHQYMQAWYTLYYVYCIMRYTYTVHSTFLYSWGTAAMMSTKRGWLDSPYLLDILVFSLP